MRKSQFIFVLMLSTSFATMARADDTSSLANCEGAAGKGNCVKIEGSNTYYALSGVAGNKTMTIYGKTESGSTAATVPGDAFFDDESWESTFPGGVTSLKTSGNVDIGDWAFWNARYLRSVDLTGVQTIGDSAFAYATNLTSVVISDSLLDAGGNITGISSNAFLHTELSTIYCPEGNACGNSFTGVTPDTIPYSKNDDGTYSVGENMYANADMMTKNIACENADQCAALQRALNAGNTCALQYATPQPTKPQRADIRIYTIDEANAVAGKTNSVKIRYR